MAINASIGIDGVQLAAATASIFTPGTGVTRAQVMAASFHAHVAGQLQVFIVPSGGAAGTTNQIIDRALALDETYVAPELVQQSIEAGGSLQANDATGSSINFVGTVRTFTGNS